MTRLAERAQAINLAQGFPDFPAPAFIKDAACRAIQSDVNQYSITWGARRLRQAIARKYERWYDWQVDPEREVTVCCGSTECMISAILGVVDPGDKVIVFEPFYENYGPDAIIAGAEPEFMPLEAGRDWGLDLDSFRRRIESCCAGGRVRALILNTPNNPTGRVFTPDELAVIAELARQEDFLVITDEIYEHILYDGRRHQPIALLPGMKERTITVSGLSKTFSVTGWRIGYIVAPEEITPSIRKMHDFLTVGAPAPLQEAAAEALDQADAYFHELAAGYQQRRNLIVQILDHCGFRPWNPEGAYYVLCDISGLTEKDDTSFVRQLIEEVGVAAVPGSSFFHDKALGRHLIRFAFCKSIPLLEEAGRRLARVRSLG